MINESDIGTERNLETSSCCPRRVIVIDVDDQYVHFQTRDLINHKMAKDEFFATSYRVGGMK